MNAVRSTRHRPRTSYVECPARRGRAPAQPRPAGAVVGGGVAAGLLAALAACAVHPLTPSGPPSTPTPTPMRGRADPVQTTKGPAPRPAEPRAGAGPGQRDTALAAYTRFWAVASELDSHPRARWRPLLAAVAGDPLLSAVLSGLDGEAALGHRQYGQVIPRPRLITTTPTRVSILDCQDASRSGLLDTDTGLPVSVGAARTPLSAVVAAGPDGRWRVVQARYLPGTCQP
jgi:hypothetical protein